MKPNNLGKFIRAAMLEQDMNQVEFAKKVDCSQSTIARALHGQIHDPSLGFLVKLSNATQHDIASIIYMIRPDAFQGPPAIDILESRIKRLPAKQRALIEALLLGLAVEQGNEAGNGK